MGGRLDPTAWIKKELLRLYPEADPRLQSAGTSPGIDLDGDGWINPAEEIGDLDGDGLAAGEADWELYFYRHADFLELLGGSFAHAGYFAADNIVHNWLSIYQDSIAEQLIEPLYDRLKETGQRVETNSRKKSPDDLGKGSGINPWEIVQATSDLWKDGEYAHLSPMTERVLQTHFGVSVMETQSYAEFIAATFMQLGAEALFRGQFAKALQLYKEADGTYRTLMSLSVQAYLYARLKDLEQAENLVKEAEKIRGSERHKNFLRAKGYLFYKRKDYQNALKYYNPLINVVPDGTVLNQLLTERGIIYFESGNYAAARRDFEAAAMDSKLADSGKNIFSINYSFQSFFTAESYYHLGLFHLKHNSLNSADLNFAKALGVNNRDPRYHLGKGEGLLRMGASKKALDHFRKAIELGMETWEAFFNAGIAQNNVKDWEGALADLERCLTIAPDDPDCLCERGVARSNLWQLEGALEDFNACIGKKRDPEIQALFLVHRGLIYYRKKEWKVAARDFDEASRIKSKNQKLSYYTLGLCRIEMGEYDKAITALDRAIALDPSDTKARKARLTALRKKLGLPEE